jgi:hypothetical protein
MKKRLNHIKTAEYKYIDQEIHVSKKAIRSRSILTVFLLMFGVVRGPGVLCVVEQRLNANVYVNILEQVMLPFVAQAFPDNFTFQQDNCPIHTSAIAQNWFRDNDINVLPWPSRSPDINPIENIWGIMMNSMRRRNIRPQNRQDLINAINVEWHNLTPEFCQHLISSMPRRLNSVIEKNGAAIKY